MASETTYQLYIHLRRPCRIQAGCLPAQRIPAGWYIYTGSARRNLRARVERHLRRDKPRRWHIDWLLTRAEARVVHVRLSATPECTANAAIGGQVLIAGFGASDCHAACGSHLRYLGTDRPSAVPATSLRQRRPGQQALRAALESR